jgi:hypothetical protein
VICRLQGTGIISRKRWERARAPGGDRLEEAECANRKAYSAFDLHNIKIDQDAITDAKLAWNVLDRY